MNHNLNLQGFLCSFNAQSFSSTFTKLIWQARTVQKLTVEKILIEQILGEKYDVYHLTICLNLV